MNQHELRLKSRGVNHAEAFCLMQYQDEVTGQIEILWNSRDGVTPFVISSPKGNSAKHVNWPADEYAPDHTPALGDRVFVTLTPERAREHTKRYVERFWDEANMADHFDTKEEAIDSLSERKDGEPDVITVDEEYLAKIEEDRKNRPRKPRNTMAGKRFA